MNDFNYLLNDAWKSLCFEHIDYYNNHYTIKQKQILTGLFHLKNTVNHIVDCYNLPSKNFMFEDYHGNVIEFNVLQCLKLNNPGNTVDPTMYHKLEKDI